MRRGRRKSANTWLSVEVMHEPVRGVEKGDLMDEFENSNRAEEENRQH